MLSILFAALPVLAVMLFPLLIPVLAHLAHLISGPFRGPEQESVHDRLRARRQLEAAEQR